MTAEGGRKLDPCAPPLHRRAARLRAARHRVVWLGLSVAALLALLTVPALAVTPKPNMWGPYYAGHNGPVGGSFTVAHHELQYFEDSQACLGTTQGPGLGPGTTFTSENYFVIRASLPVSKGGKFSYSGKADLDTFPANGEFGATGATVVTGTPPPPVSSVMVKLTGRFSSPKTAKIKFTLSYGACRPTSLTIKWDGPGAP
jgi:hypothetical protein